MEYLGIILIIAVVLGLFILNRKFVIWYFNLKKIENLLAEIAENTKKTKKGSK